MRKRNVLIVFLILFSIGVLAVRADYIKQLDLVNVINIVRVGNGTDTIYFDPVDRSLVQIDLPHHKIHEGKYWTASSFDDDVDIAAPSQWLVVTPDTGWIHMFYELSTSAAGRFEFFENTTTADNGTTILLINNKRGYGESGLVAFNETTIIAEGDLMQEGFIGSGSGKKSIGAYNSRSVEVIMYPATYYMMRFIPEADNGKSSIVLNFYKVD